MHLYLMRHGQSHANLVDLTVSHRDEPLTDLGVEQVDAAAGYVAENLNLSAIYASTVSRALQTARIVGQRTGLEVRPDDRVREIGTARPDGTPITGEDLRPYVPKMWGTQRPYEPVSEGSESWMQFRSRIGSFLESLVPVRGRFGDRTRDPDPAHDDEQLLVVCHAGVIEAAFEYVFEKGPWSAVAIHTNNAALVHLQYAPREGLPDWWLHAHNETRYLSADLLT